MDSELVSRTEGKIMRRHDEKLEMTDGVANEFAGESNHDRGYGV